MKSIASLFAFLTSISLPTLLNAQNPKLQVVIIEGQGAINNIKQKTNVEPVVEVQDENRKPVPGAAVVFFLPSQGPGGMFANGSRTLTATTDHDGRAIARGIQFTQTGQFEIRVTASYQGETASAVITQNNIAGISASGGGRSISTKAIIIVALIAGGIAGGILAAEHAGGGSSSSSGGPAPIVITAGTPTVGGPH
jgi:hypothetical protein